MIPFKNAVALVVCAPLQASTQPVSAERHPACPALLGGGGPGLSVSLFHIKVFTLPFCSLPCVPSAPSCMHWSRPRGLWAFSSPSPLGPYLVGSLLHHRFSTSVSWSGWPSLRVGRVLHTL